MKNKLFENVGGNKFKLNEDGGAANAIADIEAQKGMYKNFEIDYSQGATFSNNLLALYGIGKRGPVWLTSFENNGEPMSKEEIVDVLNKVGLGKLANQIPNNYDSDAQGFQGSHA